MLEIRNLTSGYGSVAAIRDVTISVPTGKCVCLIGANGAGKTTTLLTICGLVRAFSGQILINSEDVPRASTSNIVRAGVSLVPEGRRIVANMSIEDNLLVGAYTRGKDAAVSEDVAAIYERFPILGKRRKQYAGSLSGGEQQMLAIGRALMARPKVLLLDEPSMGLAPHVVNDIFDAIRQVNERGTTILLVEQNARKALSIAHYGYVLEQGQIQLSGTAEELRVSPVVKAAYLGENA